MTSVWRRKPYKLGDSILKTAILWFKAESEEKPERRNPGSVMEMLLIRRNERLSGWFDLSEEALTKRVNVELSTAEWQFVLDTTVNKVKDCSCSVIDSCPASCTHCLQVELKDNFVRIMNVEGIRWSSDQLTKDKCKYLMICLVGSV